MTLAFRLVARNLRAFPIRPIRIVRLTFAYYLLRNEAQTAADLQNEIE